MKKILQIIVITLLFPLATNAQWVATTNPGAGGVVFIGTFGTKIFAGA